MARVDKLYPPGPRDVPEDLTVPSTSYQTRIVLMLYSLIVFFGIYLALVCGTGLMIPLSLLVFPFGLPITFLSVLFFLFLVKNLFKVQGDRSDSFKLEVTAEEHPKLFAFIERLCEDTGAPLPHKVYISADVNAAMINQISVLGLILPGQKYLLIGMGLLNVLTMSELKAVLAHEFGHFSQKSSSKLNRYVYFANRMICDMVVGEDWFDRMILAMCRMRSRRHVRYVGGGSGYQESPNLITFIGWICWGVIWLFRHLLVWAFSGINLLNRSLSRQMEFHADLVAVSVTGSDALIHALWRCDFAQAALMQAKEDLRIASQHELYSSDLFYHQSNAAAYLRRVRKDPNLGEPPPLPEDPECSPEVFEPSDETTTELWATHPPCYDREENAKTIYIRCDLDDRTPWLLFDEPEELRERLTRKFYKHEFGVPSDTDLDAPQSVQQFIDDEHAETTYDARYFGCYDGRFVNPGKLEELEETVREKPWKADVAARVHERLYSSDLQRHMVEYHRLRDDLDTLQKLRRETKEEETFRFRGRRYEPSEASRLIKQVQGELDEEVDWLAEVDRRVFRVFYQMAIALGDKVADDLLYRYEFHLALQAIARDVIAQQGPLNAALHMLVNSPKGMHPEQFRQTRTIFREAHEALVRSVTLADKMTLPKLKNMDEGEPLGHFLLEKQVVKGLRPSARTLTVKWISKFLQQLSVVEDRARRIHFKSLGGILALQEDISRRWIARHTGKEVPAPAAPAKPSSAKTAAVKPAAPTKPKK
jgi:Zn-dependent protease with chaperone function